MSYIAPTTRKTNIIASGAPDWFSQLKAHLSSTHSAIEQARSQQRIRDRLPDAAFHDAGLSRDDALAIGSHHPALPFFLQSGFGKR